MNTAHSYTIKAALEDKHTDLQELSEALFSNVADQLEEALLSSSKLPLSDISNQLAKLFQMHFKKVAPPVRDVVRAKKDTVPVETVQAYKLGQIAFAYLIAAQATERRADDAFMSLLRQSKNSAYFKGLLKQAMTNQELVIATSNQPETVSRKLKQFRELGIADFRKDGRSVFNFLTPVAKAALQTLPEFSESSEVQKAIAQGMSEKKRELQSRIRPHLRNSMTFGMEKSIQSKEASYAAS